MTFIRKRTAPIREKRTSAVSAWHGGIGALIKELDESGLTQRIRTFAQDSRSDLIAALEVLSTVRGIAIVVHGPAGCAAGLHRADAEQSPPWIVTHVNERDSILGGDAKLREAILQIHASAKPRAIAIVSTPVVVINNDDIDSVAEELRETLGIPIVPVFTDGFRSKIAETGFDVLVHGLVKHLLPEATPPQKAHIDLLTLEENRESLAGLEATLAELGVKALGFPRHFDAGEAQEVASARLSVAIDAGSADYAGQALRDVHGIPYLAPPAPVGIRGSSAWLLAIGQALGLEARARKLAEAHSAQIRHRAQDIAQLHGRKVFIHLPASQALSFWHFAQELGLEVVAIKLPFLDETHIEAIREIAASHKALPILVGSGQAFEETQLLRSARPDLYISRAADALPAARLGIATLPLDRLDWLGFSGAHTLITQIARRIAGNQFQRFLAEGENEPYAGSWLRKSANWYIKQEVK